MQEIKHQTFEFKIGNVDIQNDFVEMNVQDIELIKGYHWEQNTRQRGERKRHFVPYLNSFNFFEGALFWTKSSLCLGVKRPGQG